MIDWLTVKKLQEIVWLTVSQQQENNWLIVGFQETDSLTVSQKQEMIGWLIKRHMALTVCSIQHFLLSF